MITSNAYLQLPDMTENATELWPLFKAMGWTEYAIAGMFGNLQTESTFNPGIWEGLNAGNTSGGYGLVQWTPATKYFNWCRDNGWTDYSNYEHQLARIQWELENREQYYPTSKYPLTFAEFIKYTPDTSIGMTDEQCVKYLADAWLKNYERPSNQNQPKRGSQAWYWYQVLAQGEPEPPPEPPTPPPDPPPEPEPENEYLYLWEWNGNFYLKMTQNPLYFLPWQVRRISTDIVKYRDTLFYFIGNGYYKPKG